MIKLNINGLELIGHEGQTILDVCNENNIHIPTLCHDERVKMYGSCGVCVVEAEGSPRLLRSCSTLVAEGMIIKTNSPKIEETRRTALELLLSDHKGDCRPPCVEACPGKTDCQGYVGLIANGEYEKAVEVIKDKLPLPASIGRVCPHPCETACRRKLVEEPISIASLKYFAADIDKNKQTPYLPELAKETGKSVAIIGGGPGGLSLAYFLRRKGVAATIFDAMPKMGGMLRYGIPEYRLPKSIIDEEVAIIEQLGVVMKNNVKIGRDTNLLHLRDKFNAVCVAVGAWSSSALGCDGENAEGVIGGIDFLRKVALNETLFIGKNVAVVGGGNTAMDACRTAVRLGAENVYNIYRRTKAEMPAEMIEIEEAEEEGVIFKNLTNPSEIISKDGKVSEIKLQIMQLGEADASGRRSPVPVKDKFETIAVDTVIIAIGQGLDPVGLEGIALTKRGTISADESTFRTSEHGVFAIGDATNKGADIAITAIGEARRAADVILSFLCGKETPYKEPYIVKREDLTEDDFADRDKLPRIKMNHVSPSVRRANFGEINFGFNEEEAVKEAKRCLECGCHDYFECKLIAYSNDYDVKPEKYAGVVHSREKLADNSHPFIKRNPDKCILCGLCVRVCDELIGSTALGLASRGFETVVKTALDLPLKETDCISCGQCVTVCPTGALLEVTGAKKQLPAKEQAVHTTCSFCGTGCGTILTKVGNTLFKSLPDSSCQKDAILCSKGRFGIVNNQMKLKRLIKPLLLANGKQTETDFYSANMLVAKKIQGFINKYGKSAVKVSVSDKLTNEEVFLIKKYTTEVLGIDKPFSFSSKKSGFKAVFGREGSATSQEELFNAEMAIVFEKDIFASNTVTAIRLKQCAENGQQLVSIHGGNSRLSEYGKSVIAEDNLDVLKQLLKVLFELSSPKNAENADELKKFVSDATVCPEIKEIAESYYKAKSAVIVVEQDAFGFEAQTLIAAMAVVSGKIGRARNGFVTLKQNCNSQGLSDIGICRDSQRHIKEIESGEVKALLNFGEDVQADLSKLEFVMSADVYETETTKQSHLVLPLAAFSESTGSYTNTFRKTVGLNSAMKPISGMDNISLISNLANVSVNNFNYNCIDDIQADIQIEQNVEVNNWPYLYQNGFETDSKAAKLLVPESGKNALFANVFNTNISHRIFVE